MSIEATKSKNVYKSSVSSRKRASIARKRSSTAHKQSSTAIKKDGPVVVQAKSSIDQLVTQFVLPLGNGWVVKSSNSKTFVVITDTKSEAISLGRSLARTKKSEFIVHNKDGKIAIKESYSKIN